MKKFFIFIVLTFLSAQPLYSYEADDSVDEIIRKHYNTQNSNNLPKLPNTSPKSIESNNFLDTGVPATEKHAADELRSSDNVPAVPLKRNVRTFKVNKWRKVNAKLLTPVSDTSKTGKQITFVTLEPMYSKSFEIPKGTRITGTVVKTHTPNFSGNGGLVSIKTELISYNGNQSYFEGNIVKLNHKRVLFNNIKGKNGYVKGVSRAMRPAKTFYGKSLKLTKKMIKTPFAILSPVVYLPSVVFLAAGGVVSPFAALFSKGERVYIPKDTPLTIKLTSPSYIEY